MSFFGFGGGGAYSGGTPSTQPGVGNAGYPAGGAGGYDGGLHGGWGFGGGGTPGTSCPGGGGGYSGGGAGVHFEGSSNGAAGGGGGSYANPLYNLAPAPEFGPSPNVKNGRAFWEIIGIGLINDDPATARVLDLGVNPLQGLFCNTTSTHLDHCGVAVPDKDIWYRYRNDSTCPHQVNVSITQGQSVVYSYHGDPNNLVCSSGSKGASTFQESVQPGQEVFLRMISAGNQGLFGQIEVEEGNIPNNSFTNPAPLPDGQATAGSFCNATFEPLGAFCDVSMIPGLADAWYRYTNPTSCEIDLTIVATGGVDRIYGYDTVGYITQVCRNWTQDGTYLDTLDAGQAIYVRVVTDSGNDFTLTPSSVYSATAPDCDLDGIPDGCDIDDFCEAPNDDMADAIGLPLGQTPYSTAYATLDGSSSCTSVSVPGPVVDVWYTYTATSNGQLIAGALSDAHGGLGTYVNLTAFTPDGLTELDCDYGEDSGNFPGGVGTVRDAAIFVSMKAGDTVLLRLSNPDEPPTSNWHTGILETLFFESFTNDRCDTALPVDFEGVGSVILPFDVSLARREGDIGFQCLPQSGMEWYDAWYAVTFYLDATATINTASSVGQPYTSVIEVYDDCGGSVLACESGSAEAPYLYLNVTHGQRVLVRVAGLYTQSPHNRLRITIEETQTFCDSKTNSLGCEATISYSGLPTTSGLDDFEIRAENVIPDTTGFLLIGLNPNPAVFQGSLVGVGASPRGARYCILQPTNVLAEESGGIPGTCTGVLDFALTRELMTQHGFSPDFSAYAQVVYQDPNHPDGSGFSYTEALRFLVHP